MKKLIMPILALILFSLLVIGAGTGNLPFPLNRVYDIPLGDKIGHVLIMGMVTLAVMTALRGVAMPYRRRFTVIAVALLLILFTAEEFSQKFNPLRTFCYADLLCSYLGVIGGTVLSQIRLSRKKVRFAEMTCW